MNRRLTCFILSMLFLLPGCRQDKKNTTKTNQQTEQRKPTPPKEQVEKKKVFTAEDIILKKELLYNKYTLEDSYPYKDTTRGFQWDKIKVLGGLYP